MRYFIYLVMYDFEKTMQSRARVNSHTGINQISIVMHRECYREQKTFVDISGDDIIKKMTCEQVMIILPLT